MGKKGKGKRKKQRKKAALLAATEAAALEAGSGGADGVVVDLADERRRNVGSTELAARLAGLSTVLQRHLSRADTGEGLTRARLSALALLVLGWPRTLGELAAD